MEQAYRRYVERVDPTLPSGDLEPNLADTAIELGAIYRSDAIVADGSDTGERVEAPEQPSGRPGTRLAHLWLQADGQGVSTLDLAGDDLVLLAGPDGRAWMAAGRKAGVEARTIDDGGLLAAAGLGSAGALVLRPDGVIGWRSRGSASDPDAVLAGAIRRLTGR